MTRLKDLWWAIRCWDLWEWDCLNPTRDKWPAYALMAFGPPAFVLFFVTLVVFSAPYASAWYLYGTLMGMGVWVPLVSLAGRMDPIRYLSRRKGRGHYNRYDNHHADLYRAGVEYVNLTRSERSEYPKGILSIMQDPDLTRDQQEQLIEQMKSLREGIVERRKARAVLEKRNVDISSVLEYMSHQTEGITAQAETYKEFAQ